MPIGTSSWRTIRQFGDILSDLGPACTGTIGIAPSANLNPVGQIWAGAMMLEHLGCPDAGAELLRAIESVLAEGPRTPDMGGEATTTDVGKAIAGLVNR